jgi:hypothetical protein
MALEKDEVKLFSNWLKKSGANLVLDEKVITKFPFRPDIVVREADILRAYFIRRSDTIPETILQRLSLMQPIHNEPCELYVVFPKMVSSTTHTLCSKYGVGSLTKTKKAYKILSPGKLIGAPPKSAPKPKIKMVQTDLFFSSKQILEERDVAKDLIDLVRNSMKKPVYAKLVEDDQRYNEMSKSNLKELIKLCMNESDYTVCFLSDEYRAIVNWEVRHALETLPIDRVIIFLKSSKEAKKSWTDLLHYIHLKYAIHGKTVKYIEYIDTRDFRSKFHERLMLLISDIHKKMGIPFI